MSARRVTTKDYLIWELLQDPDWRVTADGEVHTRRKCSGVGPWRRAGWVSPSRAGTKCYRRVQFRGEELYEHRIVCAVKDGYLDPQKTVDHDDHNGLNNHPTNLRQIEPGENTRRARALYRRMGMTAAEAKASWIRAAEEKRHANEHR